MYYTYWKVLNVLGLCNVNSMNRCLPFKRLNKFSKFREKDNKAKLCVIHGTLAYGLASFLLLYARGSGSLLCVNICDFIADWDRGVVAFTQQLTHTIVRLKANQDLVRQVVSDLLFALHQSLQVCIHANSKGQHQGFLVVFFCLNQTALV